MARVEEAVAETNGAQPMALAHFLYGTCPLGRHRQVLGTPVYVLCPSLSTKLVSYGFQVLILTDYFVYILCLSSQSQENALRGNFG